MTRVECCGGHLAEGEFGAEDDELCSGCPYLDVVQPESEAEAQAMRDFLESPDL